MKKSNKRAALTLAVLSALSPIIGGASEAAVDEQGQPILPGIHYIGNGQFYTGDEQYGGGINTYNILSYDEDSIVGRTYQGDVIAYSTEEPYDISAGGCRAYYGRGGRNGRVKTAGACATAFKSWKGHIIIGVDDGHNGLVAIDTPSAGGSGSDNSKANKNLNNIDDTGRQVIKNTVIGDINTARDTAINTAAGDATNKANAAGTNAKNYTDEIAKDKANIGLDNINEHGEQVIRNIAKDEMKNSGIDTTGDTIIIDKPMKTKDIYVDGKIDTTGDAHIGGNITVDGDSHIKGNSEVDGDSHIHGSETIDKDLNVKGKTTTGELEVIGKATFDKDTETKGNATFDKDVTVKGNTDTGTLTVEGDSHMKGNVQIDKNLTVDGDSHVKGNSEVDGDSHIHGSETVDKNFAVHGNETVDGDSTVHGNAQIDKDLTVYGNTNLKGDVRTDGNLQVLGDSQLGNDKTKDTIDVYAKTNLHGDTTIGDNAGDRLTVNATSEFKADSTFDKNVHVKGNESIDGGLDIKGDSVVHGNSTVDGNSHIKGSSETDGDSKIHGNEEIDKNLSVKGDSTVGGNSTVKGDFKAEGNSEIGKDLHVVGNTGIDRNLSVGEDASIQKNLFVGGGAKIDGDIYGRSFNVGNERYIDKDGINANGHVIRNVADGVIGPDSLDAVNGRQLWDVKTHLSQNIEGVAAQAAAMANLHPLDYENSDRVSVSASIGAYKGSTSGAIGAFYRPDRKSMISITGAIGSSNNMYGIGFSKKLGETSDVENLTDEQLKATISDVREENTEIKKSMSSIQKAYQALQEQMHVVMMKLKNK